jgi:SAM-dependent methyltransferase
VIPARAVVWLDRVNAAHPWSHNDAYAGFVLRQAAKAVREGGRSAADIGCGTGHLLRRLAPLFEQTVGIEANPASAGRAAQAVRSLPGAQVVVERFPLADGRSYDFVALVAVLHHLPLLAGIEAVRSAVAPGGRLAIVGLYREEPSDAWLSLASVLLNPVLGLVRHPRRATATPEHMTAPTAPASDSYAEIAGALSEALPGVRVRRGLFWRYTASWRAPR